MINEEQRALGPAALRFAPTRVARMDQQPTERGGPQHIPRPKIWAPGSQAPWEALEASQRQFDLDVLEQRLAASTPGSTITGAPAPRRTSAILAALYTAADESHIILTRRPGHMRAHGGEVSFPGGGQDHGESLWGTAEREAEEEIGLPRGAARQIGQLDRLATVSSQAEIVPFVGRLEQRPDLVASPDEVEAILHVSLTELLTDGVYREERWEIERVGTRSIHFFELHGDSVWGATAAMLRNLLVVGLGLGNE